MYEFEVGLFAKRPDDQAADPPEPDARADSSSGRRRTIMSSVVLVVMAFVAVAMAALQSALEAEAADIAEETIVELTTEPVGA